MKALIEKLVSIPGPSGYESFVREAIQENIQPYVDECITDGLGNLIALKGKKSKNGKKIMVAAHMDEIGLMVTHVDQNGFARFTNLGAVRAYYTIGGRVRFLNGATGVIGMEPQTNPSNLPPVEKMFIDFGVESEEDCPVEIGDVAVFDRSFEQLGHRLVAKALDNRCGVVILMEALRRLGDSPNEIAALFSVQEEVGARGSGPAAYKVAPDLSIVIDATSAGDTPKNQASQVKLGSGPAVHIKDGLSLATPEVSNWIISSSKNLGIPIQVSILGGAYTDVRSIQPSRAGVPTGGIAYPCRYVHSSSEMVDVRDLEAAIRLVVEMLSKQVIL